MPSTLVNFLLFLPLFLLVNMVAAVPGRRDLKEAARVGFRHFVVGTVVLLIVGTALFLLMAWFTRRTPLW
ncbi:MAG TPA: hypothetical protein PKA37_08125 [Planctomycetota bacterium]|jgi:hypothetical protein|nr:hypothetical protein [Planctomycetota bacterium]